MYKVSIIIPIYNAQKYLEKCIKSAVNQTLKEIEVICINNGSSDIEQNILKEYSRKKKKKKIINFEINQGYGKAVNEGIKSAQGEYISILESDDFVDSNMMEFLYNKAKENDVDIIKSAYIAFNEYSEKLYLNDLDIDENKVFKINEYPEFFSKHPSIWTCLYKRSFLISNDICFIEAEDTGWVDNHFSVKSLLMAKKIQYVKDAFYHYRVDQQDSSSTLREGLVLPYKASLQVHNFLNEKGIENKGIYTNLAIREWAYIKDIINKCPYSEISCAQDVIKNLFDLIGDSLNDNKKFMKFKKKIYKKSIYYLLLKRDIKSFIKKRFYIKIRYSSLTRYLLCSRLLVGRGRK